MKNDLFSIGPLTIHSYGLMIALGILVCVFMGMYRARKHGYKDEAVLDIAIFGILSGFIGAKLLYVLVEFDRFLENPMDVLGSEGFVVYGGIIVGALAGVIYCRVKKLPFWEYFDLLAPSIAVAQGFGRIGCFLAGCCYGRPTEAFWGVTFPEGSFAPAGVPLIPTQLISSVGDFTVAGILLLYSKHNKKAGNVGILYMVLYGIGRFLVECLRSDDRGTVGILSTSQFISIAIILFAIVLFFRHKIFKGIKKENSEEV
ncbi:prolipoprotein diacylglyceryl transferase [Blautia sp. Marseille-P3201T]|uniref:prolipoprotein diacylglyceryl transferase n=1 Tax=Blautia sp. Marseille-P3201T TaxID=1907659 RepID=UPI000931FB84|nr:prolipoprotein diacylglyceryl transferase [Blautia sp. Marseille-P3201T]